jgi:glycosyltransferase involved in cell wall biosynthesis
MILSIITVNLNNCDGLRKTVESVLAQAWREFEYLVIDGASTDGSAEYLESVSKDLNWAVSEKDRGIYEAMNKGIEKATGDYLLFLNSGDFLATENILEEIHSELTGEGIIYGDLSLVKNDGTTEPKIYPDQLTYGYVWEQSLPHPAAFIRRDLFDRLGQYNVKARITADWQFFMLALFSFGTDYKHINRSITVFNLNGICNDPRNLKQIAKEKNQFYSPKILMVAMADSIHTARWVSQLQVEGYRLRVGVGTSPVTSHSSLLLYPSYELPTTRLKRLVRRIKKRLDPNYRANELASLVRRFKPDIIHSMETQGAGYLVEEVRSLIVKKNGKFPKWWHSNWGSDIYLFGRLAEHKERIRKVMEHCDYYSCEGQRDVELAKQFGFKGTILPVYPSGGGLKAELLERLRKNTVITSQRQVIMLKGYQGWAGRALAGIRALERCADVLSGYTIVIYCNSQGPDIKIAAELLSQSTGIEVKRLPANTPNEEILAWHGKARISIGLSISDAISTSLLEAMAMGSFPIQSNTSCGEEWIIDGETGILVPPEDPEIIEQAIRKALKNDGLVDAAAITNVNKIGNDADFETLKDISLQSCFKIVKANKV